MTELPHYFLEFDIRDERRRVLVDRAPARAPARARRWCRCPSSGRASWSSRRGCRSWWRARSTSRTRGGTGCARRRPRRRWIRTGRRLETDSVGPGGGALHQGGGPGRRRRAGPLQVDPRVVPDGGGRLGQPLAGPADRAQPARGGRRSVRAAGGGRGAGRDERACRSWRPGRRSTTTRSLPGSPTSSRRPSWRPRRRTRPSTRRATSGPTRSWRSARSIESPGVRAPPTRRRGRSSPRPCSSTTSASPRPPGSRARSSRRAATRPAATPWRGRRCGGSASRSPCASTSAR